MNKEEMKAKISELNEKIKGLGDKAKDTVDTAIIVGMEAKDKVNDAIKETKGNVNALKENYSIFSKRVKGKASSELLKAQMNFDKAKAEMEARKEIHDKEKLEKYIEDMIEYAETCVILSALAAEEAKLAGLEAMEAQKEYDEKYGE